MQPASLTTFYQQLATATDKDLNALLPPDMQQDIGVFALTEEDYAEIEVVFRKMVREITSTYAFKYDLLRTYVLELLHRGQKLQPVAACYPAHTAAARVTSLFVQLLEHPFPIETPQQRPQPRTAKDYADRLAVHVNHLNKVLKDNTGRTTTELIGGRITQEAKLLQQTNWNISPAKPPPRLPATGANWGKVPARFRVSLKKAKRE